MKLPGAGAVLRELRGAERPPGAALLEADGRPAPGPHGAYRPADGGGLGGPAAPAGRALRRLQPAGGPGQFPVGGPVPHHRLLGAGGLRASGGAGKGLRGPGGHQLWVGGHRPTPPLLSAGRFRLRPHPLPAALGAEDGRPGPGGTPAGVGPARGVRRAAPPPGVQDGTKGQAGVRPGAAAPRDLQAGRGARPQ